MVGFTLLSRSYYYLRRRSPGPPFPPDHRQAGERGAIIPGLCATGLAHRPGAHVGWEPHRSNALRAMPPPLKLCIAGCTVGSLAAEAGGCQKLRAARERLHSRGVLGQE